MHKLAAVEDAKSLFNEAKNWSLWRWLFEKRRARTTADAAWAALEACEEKVKSGWAEEWQQAYLDLSTNGRRKSRRHAGLDPELKAALESLHEADEIGPSGPRRGGSPVRRGRPPPEHRMACEGAQMALDAWELREKFIRKAEALARRK